MVCIASAIVLLLLSAVSARFRPLAKKAWGCAARRLTLRPCDTTFREEVKNTLLAPLAIRAPRWVRPASLAIEATAWVMVLSMVVSFYVLARSGLNFAVYGTCNKENPEACSLAAEACTIGVQHPTFMASLRQGDVGEAFYNEFTGLADTIATIPSRLRTWDATNFLADYASFRNGFDPARPTAVEVIDPGCGICAELFQNIADAGFDQTHNLSYVAYPIMRDGQPQFRNSLLTAQYLSAIRIHEAGNPERETNPTDWAILTELYLGNVRGTLSWQFWFNELASSQEAEAQLQDWLRDAGYSEAEVAEVTTLAHSDQVAQVLDNSRNLVENEIRTLHIPTLIADGGIHRGAVAVERLERMMN